jgi:hypothetical protein
MVVKPARAAQRNSQTIQQAGHTSGSSKLLCDVLCLLCDARLQRLLLRCALAAVASCSAACLAAQTVLLPRGSCRCNYASLAHCAGSWQLCSCTQGSFLCYHHNRLEPTRAGHSCVWQYEAYSLPLLPLLLPLLLLLPRVSHRRLHCYGRRKCSASSFKTRWGSHCNGIH